MVVPLIDSWTHEVIDDMHEDDFTRGEMLRTRFECRTSENAWRGLERNTIVALGGGSLLGAVPLGVYALGVPIVLLFIAAMWLQTDMRMGSNAGYMRDKLEPKMAEIDGVESYEAYLLGERSNCPKLPFTLLPFTAIAPRIFPAMQLMAIGAGLRSYFLEPNQGDPLVAIVVMTVLDVIVTVVTFMNVKHIRTLSPDPQS